MMRRLQAFIIGFAAAAMFVLASAAWPEATRRDQVEPASEVKVVRNPAEPLNGLVVLDLVEDLSIGGEDDEHAYFYKGAPEIAVDPAGDIYALDKVESGIKKFDRTGRFLLSFGRKGQGPGEFINPNRLFIDGRGRVCVLDGPRIHAFDAEGRLEETIGLPVSPLAAGLTEDGKVVCVFRTFEPDETTTELALFDRGDKKTVLFRHSVPVTYTTEASRKPGEQKETVRRRRVITAESLYNPRLFFAPRPGGAAVYGVSQDYRLTCLDGRGRAELIIEKTEAPRPITEAMRRSYHKSTYDALRRPNPLRRPAFKPLSMEEIRAQFPLPDVYPFFAGLVSDDQGNIFVVRTPPLEPGRQPIELDVFDRSGRYVSAAQMRTGLDAIAGGFLYSVVPDDETGLSLIKRFRIANWSRLGLGPAS